MAAWMQRLLGAALAIAALAAVALGAATPMLERHEKVKATEVIPVPVRIA